MSALVKICQRITGEAEQYQRNGMPFPAWMIKCLQGIDIMPTDPKRGIALLLDGLQDKRHYLDTVKFPRTQ